MIFFLTLLTLKVNAHSWIACADYVGGFEQEYAQASCLGFARGYADYNTDIFGLDRGYNHRVQLGEKVCKTEYTGVDVRYKPYSDIVLVWPSKNHVASTCTNAWIPDTQLKLYGSCNPNDVGSNPTLATVLSSYNLIWDFKTQGSKKGFQNCPHFCKNPDKASCFGVFQVLPSMQGKCHFVWFWEFNVGEYYTTCIDVNIDKSSQVSPIPSTQSRCASLKRQVSSTTRCSSKTVTLMKQYIKECT